MEQTRPNAAPAAAPQRDWRVVAALALGDLVALLVFAAIGRRSHGEAAGLDALLEVAGTAAPFIVGWFAVAPWLGAFRVDARARSQESGVRSQESELLATRHASRVTRHASPGGMLRRTALAWLLAWPVGLLLRALLLGRGIPLSFALVTFVSVLVILGVWRAVFAWVVGRRS